MTTCDLPPQAMPTYVVTLENLLDLHRQHGNLLFETSEPLSRGTVVVCSTVGWLGPVEDLGRVVRDGEVMDLPEVNGEQHPDGDAGEVYVQTWSTVKMPSLKQCASKLLAAFDCMHVVFVCWLHLIACMLFCWPHLITLDL